MKYFQITKTVTVTLVDIS